MKLEVTDKITQKITGSGRKIGNQEVWAFLPDSKYPQKLTYTIWDDGQPLAAGNYKLNLGTAIYVDKFGNLGITLSPEHLEKV